MTPRLLVIVAAALASLSGCETRPVEPSAATYTNPVLDADFPDPAVIKASDGFYYAYATQTERDGRTINIQVARSADLVSWDHLGDALPVKPTWASRTQDFWAPDVMQANGRFFLYFSAKPDAALADESRGLCLAVATAERPDGPFTDVGRPLQCGEGFVNIDPMAFDDPASGNRLLYWGSGFGPIKVQELAPDRISFAPASRPIDLIHVDKTDSPENYQRLVEGAWVIRRGQWYYLFYSGDNCCGPNAHYAAMVARSRSATGPFETLAQATGAPNSVILEAGGIWKATGHNSVVQDARGDDWIVYHAVDARRPRSKPGDDINSRRVMLIDRLVWAGGWPRVENGPSADRRRAPAQKPAAEEFGEVRAAICTGHSTRRRNVDTRLKDTLGRMSDFHPLRTLAIAAGRTAGGDCRANNRSFSVRYMPVMVRLVLLLPLTLAACAVARIFRRLPLRPVGQ